jgi:hypothetical protein
MSAPERFDARSRLNVHGKGMEIYSAPPELVEAVKQGDVDEVSRLMNDLGPGQRYATVGERIEVGDHHDHDHEHDEHATHEGAEDEENPSRQFDLLSPGDVSVDENKFSKTLDDDTANALVEEQVGMDTLKKMLVVHQFRMAEKEVVTVDYVPEESSAVIFYFVPKELPGNPASLEGGPVEQEYDLRTFLISPGIGGEDEEQKPIDVIEFGGGPDEGENSEGTEFKLNPISPTMMAHCVVHARNLPHGSAQNMPRPS